MEDRDRESTYAAEDMVAGWIDAASPVDGCVRVAGGSGASATVTYRPETEPRFSRPQEVSGFVEIVVSRLRERTAAHLSNYRGREQRPVRVLSVRGWKHAKYEDGCIFLPEREAGGAWALRGLVVLHELAHHLNTGPDGAIIDSHGDGFRSTFVRVLRDIGWTQIASMLEHAYQAVGVADRGGAGGGMLVRIGKLLRHAEGAATLEERDAFLTKAQTLATMHSIELAVARAAHEKGEADQGPVFEACTLGHRGQASNARFIRLMLTVAGANDLRCSIRGDNTGVTLYGFASDIAVAKALYASLVLQMVADADAYIRSGAHRPVHGRTARAAFYEGWTGRMGQRLAGARRAATLKAGAGAGAVAGASDDALASGSRALALVAKEVEVADYYEYMKRQHGVRGNWRGTGDVWDGHSLRKGSVAADKARLGGEKALTGGRAGLTAPQRPVPGE